MSNTSNKKLLPAFLLCFFLGSIGAHRFYAGKVGTGIIMLVLTLTFVGILISGLWALIDLVVLLTGNFTDKEGFKIADWT